ncbi:MBL fold metallo-hydrolase [Maribacter orientalis]|nr:MBL fold metallo-hydrolase [Maribacter orientalis]
MKPFNLFKGTLLLLVVFLGAKERLHAQKAYAEGELMKEIKSHKTGLAAWWTGHNGWLIKYNDILIGTDLALETKERSISSPISAEELAKELDISFISHEHGDHFERETSEILSKNGNCVFVMPANCKETAMQELNIPENRIKVASPRIPFDIGDIHIEPVRAIHGNPKFAVFYDANLEDCGYVITIGGKRFLQMGDTVLLEDHLFLKNVDVLFFSPTEHNTHIDPSVILINELEPAYILPQHRDTFKVTDQNRYWTSGYAHEVEFRLSKTLQDRYHILDIGEKINIHGNTNSVDKNK